VCAHVYKTNSFCVGLPLFARREKHRVSVHPEKSVPDILANCLPLAHCTHQEMSSVPRTAGRKLPSLSAFSLSALLSLKVPAARPEGTQSSAHACYAAKKSPRKVKSPGTRTLGREGWCACVCACVHTFSLPLKGPQRKHRSHEGLAHTHTLSLSKPLSHTYSTLAHGKFCVYNQKMTCLPHGYHQRKAFYTEPCVSVCVLTRAMCPLSASSHEEKNVCIPT
jgi:hypothetical protein